MHKISPAKWPDTVSAAEKTNGVSPLHLIGLLATLAKTNELYYLHPSFGYYFEQFCLEPHGLVYKLNTLPDDTLLPPSPDKNLIAANEAFWARAEKPRWIRSSKPLRRAIPTHRKVSASNCWIVFISRASRTPTPPLPEFFIRAA